MGIVLNYCQYGVLYLGSYYITGPYIHFPHFGNSNLGKLPHTSRITVFVLAIPAWIKEGAVSIIQRLPRPSSGACGCN